MGYGMEGGLCLSETEAGAAVVAWLTAQVSNCVSRGLAFVFVYVCVCVCWKANNNQSVLHNTKAKRNTQTAGNNFGAVCDFNKPNDSETSMQKLF